VGARLALADDDGRRPGFTSQRAREDSEAAERIGQTTASSAFPDGHAGALDRPRHHSSVLGCAVPSGPVSTRYGWPQGVAAPTR
jgi:hypothetical protein